MPPFQYEMLFTLKMGGCIFPLMIDLFSRSGSGMVLAVGSSISYAGTLILLRRGMQTGSSMAAILLIDMIVGTGALAIAFSLGTLQTASSAQIFWFSLSGLMGAGIGTITHFIGIERIGVSRATPIHSASPIWAVFFAMAVLGERPNAPVIAGTIFIVLGVCLLSWPEKGDAPGLRGWIDKGSLYPLVSSVGYAISPIFIKLAFAHGRAPFLGIGVAFWVGLGVMLAGRRFLPGGGEIKTDRKSQKLFALAALFNLAASGFLWSAFSVGDITITLPLSRVTPLWVVFLSVFFLKDIEKVTIRILSAVILVVLGGVLITAAGAN